MNKLIYSFSEGSKQMNELLGNKGATLAEMTRLGLPVPFGFTITTEVCQNYCKEKELSENFKEQLYGKMTELEEVVSKKFEDKENPLLVSISSSSVINVPGIVDFVMDVGLNDFSVQGLSNITGSQLFAYDRYRKFIQEYSVKILGLPKQIFNEIHDEYSKKANEENRQINLDEMKEITDKYKEAVKRETGSEFPQDIKKQLRFAIVAFYNSWNSEVAVLFREKNEIDNSVGIAINFQTMVFGNTGDGSCTGVAFTRNTFNGEKKLFGDFKVNSQYNETILKDATSQPIGAMKDIMRKEYDNLVKIADIMEMHYKDVQEMKFVVEKHKLYMLQTRNAKKTAEAAIKIAVDMVNEKLISREEALMRIEPRQIEMFIEEHFDQEKLWEGKLEIKEQNSSSIIEQNTPKNKKDYIDYFRTVMRWCDDIKKIEIRSSADNPFEAAEANALGTEGIGLCRTESVLGENDEISKIGNMLNDAEIDKLNDTISQIYEIEKSNFKRIFEIMGEKKVAIRILDLPEQTKDSIFNRRGCRLAIAYPQIVKMQTRAIIEAAIEVNREQELNIIPEIVIPFVTVTEELIIIKKMINEEAKKIIEDSQVKFKFYIGTMIDTPRAALIADKLSKHSDFFLFGTNDLTNMTYGLMDEQIEEVIKQYQQEGILNDNPIQKLDSDGVGRLIKMAIELGTKEKKDLKIGICGRHTNDSDTVEFCYDMGFDFITCLPHNIPKIKLAAAQNQIKNNINFKLLNMN